MANEKSGKRKTRIACFKQGGAVFYALMLLLPVTQFLIFYIGVNFNNILLAFKSYDRVSGASAFVGWDNFIHIFDVYEAQPILRDSIINSCKYFALNLFLIVPLTLLFAYYIFKKFRYSGFFKVMLFFPSIISAMVLTVFYKSWADLAAPELLGKLFNITDIPEGLLANSTTNEATVMIFNVLLGFSSMILVYLNAMSQVPEACVEASKIDGAGEFRIFFRIVIPSIWPTLVSFILIALAGFATNQANLYSLYGDGAWTNHLSTLGYYLFELVNSGVYGGTGMYPYAAALGVFLTLIIAPITLVIRWLLNKFGPSEN